MLYKDNNNSSYLVLVVVEVQSITKYAGIAAHLGYYTAAVLLRALSLLVLLSPACSSVCMYQGHSCQRGSVYQGTQ